MTRVLLLDVAKNIKNLCVKISRFKRKLLKR